MSIRKRGTRYQVRVRLGGGRRVERTLPAGATRADAVALETTLRRRQIAAETGQVIPRLIDEALTEWETTQARHLKSYAKDLRYRIAVLREYTKRKPLEAIPDVAQKIKAAGATEGLSVAAINRYLSILRRLGNLAVRWGWTDKPLGQRVGLLPGERSREVFLTPKQVKALVGQLDAPHADFVMFAALTGMRRSEILRLQPHQVVAGEAVLDSNTKSGRPRVVPLPPQAQVIAKRRLPWVVTVKTLEKRFDAARRAIGMPHLRLHDLRHTLASWMIRGGAGLTAVRDVLGHSSLAVTSKYAHLSRPDLAQAMRRIKV